MFLCWHCQQSGVHHAVNPDPYRGIFGSDGEKYARDVQDIINFGTSGNVAAFISEAIQVSGQNQMHIIDRSNFLLPFCFFFSFYIVACPE